MQYTAPVVLGIVYGVIILLMVGTFTQKSLFRYFNVVDKRTMINSSDTVGRINAMMDAGDVSIYSSEWSDGKTFRISVSYKGKGDETTSNSFRGTDINIVTEEAYNWSVDRGFVTPEMVAPIPQEEVLQ